jgi:predicted alpha/beta-fold hydrolase
LGYFGKKLKMTLVNETPFIPAWWLKNAHAQTVWATFFRRPPAFKQLWDRFELPDGDFIDLVWDRDNATQSGAPIVLILHGLGGNIASPYAMGLMKTISKKGWRPALMHFRGSSGIHNRLARGYHSGETEDMAYIIERLQKANPGVPIAAIGISIGGNALLKWLGETGADNPLKCTVAVSVPFVLKLVAEKLQRGLSCMYQRHLLKGLKKDMKEKFLHIPCPFDYDRIDKIKNFWEFDDWITAPLHGFKDVHDYYEKSSCRQYLSKISVPTLIIHAKDDPFMTPDAIPDKSELSETIQLILTDKGGHVGFIEGSIPGMPQYWLEKTIPTHLSFYL